MKIYYWLYTILAILLFILILPYLLVKVIFTSRYREAFCQMLGFWPKEIDQKLGKKGCIWIHAASVGEAVAASSIIKELKKINSEELILVSTHLTETGNRMAKKIIPEADAFIYFPLDFPWLVRKALKRFQPKIFAMVETELWPNFLRESKELEVVNIMVNGRISDKSLPRYRQLDRFSGGMFKDMLSKLEFFSMQSEIDGQHILALGAEPRKVLVTGNTKFDQSYGQLDKKEKEDILKEFGLAAEQPIFVVGSTRKGEEEFILETFREIKQAYPDYMMILAPRHLDRTGEVEALCRQYGFSPVRRTALPKEREQVQDIILLDTIGELGKIYGLGKLVYVGGSLVATGGHNLLEPAAHGKPIFFGPHMDNFKETTQLVLSCQAGIQVANGQELTREVLQLLKEPERLARIGQAAARMIEENRGAAKKNAEIINSFLIKNRRNGEKRSSRLEDYLLDIVMKRKKGLREYLILVTLNLFSYIYQAGLKWVLWSYQLKMKKKSRLPGKVISIGNITVGGTGKTPTTQMLAKMLQDWGIKVAILNRGYRSKYKGEMALVSNGEKLYLSADEAGDEAYMLAQSLPGIPVIIGRDRVATGSYALIELGVEVVILDDGYQYWHLERDLDIVLVDVSNPFSNGRVLPRGLLREPIKNLARADLFLLTKTNYVTTEEKEKVKEILTAANPQTPIMEISYCPSYLRDFRTNEVNWNFSVLKDKKVLVVSGLSNPEFFERMVEDWKPFGIEKMRFPDHYNYSLEDLEEIARIFEEKSLDLVITTEKDAVSIPLEWEVNLPLLVLGVEIKLEQGEAGKLKEIIQERLGQQGRKSHESSGDHSSSLSI